MANNTDANVQRDSSRQGGSLPFFARFLEGQERAEQSFATLKYPSDLDEDQTMKWPSDSDEYGPDS